VNQPAAQINLRFHFHNGLEDLLPAAQRSGQVQMVCAPHQSIKHLVEALGIPHTEVGQMCLNGQPAADLFLAAAGLALKDGDRLDVYPYGRAPLPAGGARFVLDNHLGRLAIYLRMLGCDSLYRNDYQDEELAQVASSEGRILLTRDRRLLMRKSVLYGYCVRHKDPPRQLAEVVLRYDLPCQASPFQRCLRCNHPLRPVPKAEVLERLEPLTRQYFDEFHLCPACNQVYWKGSHYEHMLGMIQELIKKGKPEQDER